MAYGDKVRGLQESLVADGYRLEVDGIMGPKTRKAMQDRAARQGDSRQDEHVDDQRNPLPPKVWWLSTAAVGTLASFVSHVAGLWGWEIDPDGLATFILGIAGAVFAAIAFWGTIKRKRTIDSRAILPGVRLPDRRLRPSKVPAEYHRSVGDDQPVDQGPFMDSP
jgi:peptidoglycan hydrolase-like protein with peptidoglycan-binding domain